MGRRKTDSDIILTTYKYRAIKIAKDLFYSQECINAIEQAENEIQVDQALKKERKRV